MRTNFKSKSAAPLFLAASLTGCGNVPIEENALAAPAFDPARYFSGLIKAWGTVHNWQGKLTRHFVADIDASIANNVITLDESFIFSDGERQTRVWQLSRNADGHYVGEANDIAGQAQGETNGNAMRWSYEMDLTVSGKVYRVRFDDWLWQIDEQTLINRAKIIKFGVKVGEVVLFMRKQSSDERVANRSE
ncbi:MAG: DUF3833 domain-containing protein [Pseudomonadota bacterium]